MSRIRSVAAILHVWHADLVAELAGVLARIPAGPRVDVYVSVPEEAASAGILAVLRARIAAARIVVCENRGADVGGLFAVLRDPGFRNGYDAWCKLHTKQGGNTAPGSGAAWRKSLLLEPGFAHEGRLEHAVERAFGCFPVWGSRLAFPTQSAADEYEALGAALPFDAVDVGPGRTIETYTFPGEVRFGAFA